MNILVINGPNLNLLGTRQQDIYGDDTLDELMMWLENSPEAAGHSFKFYQSNHEGEIIDSIHDEREWAQGVLINPAAYTHYSYAIRDALLAIGTPAVEVHLSDLKSREEFRQKSVISPVCIGQVSGMGKLSYVEGIKLLTNNSS